VTFDHNGAMFGRSGGCDWLLAMGGPAGLSLALTVLGCLLYKIMVVVGRATYKALNWCFYIRVERGICKTKFAGVH